MRAAACERQSGGVAARAAAVAAALCSNFSAECALHNACVPGISGSDELTVVAPSRHPTPASSRSRPPQALRSAPLATLRKPPKMEQGRPARLRLSRTACPLLLGEASGAGSGPAPASQPGQLQFRLTHQATHHAPGRCSFALPFARQAAFARTRVLISRDAHSADAAVLHRISGRAAGSDDGVASLLQALLPADEHSTQPAARRCEAAAAPAGPTTSCSVPDASALCVQGS